MGMLSEEQIDAYRRMTPSERLSESLRLTREEMDRVMQGTPEEIDAFFDRINREHDESSRSLIEGLKRAERLGGLCKSSTDESSRDD